MSSFFDILEEVQTTIASMAGEDEPLEGLDDEQVLLRPVVVDRDITPPTILIAPGPQETITNTVLQEEDYGYPVIVCIVAAGNQDLGTEDLETYLGWREAIIKRFVHQPLADTSAHHCVVEPGLAVDPNIFIQQNLLVSTIVLRFFTRESRG